MAGNLLSVLAPTARISNCQAFPLKALHISHECCGFTILTVFARLFSS